MGNSSSTTVNATDRLPPGPFVSTSSDNLNVALRVGDRKRVGDRWSTGTPQALINARLLYRAQSAAPLIDGYPELVGSGPARKSTLRIISALHVACEAVHRHCSLAPLQERATSARGLCKDDGPLNTLLAACKEAVMPADDPSQGHILGTLLCHSGAVQAVAYLLQALHTVLQDIAPAAFGQLDTNTELFGSLGSFSSTGAAADFRTCLDVAAGLMFCLTEWCSAAATLTDSGSPSACLCTPDFVGILLSYMAYSATANVAVYACDDILHTAHVNASKTVWSRARDQASTSVDSSQHVSSATPASNTTPAVDVAQQITQRRAQARALLAGRSMDTVLAAGTSAASASASIAVTAAGRKGSFHVTGPSLHQQALLLAARSSASGRGTFRDRPSYLSIMGVSSILDVTRASGLDLPSLLLAMGPEGLASGSHVAALFAFEPGIQDPVKSPLLTTMLAMSRRVSQFSGDRLCLTSTMRGGATVQAPLDFLDMPSLADEVQLCISDSSSDSVLHPAYHTSSRRTGVLPAISQAVDAAVSAFCHAGDGILLVRLLALAATPSPPKAWKPILTILANMQAHAGSRPQAPGHYAGGLGLNNPRTLEMLGHLFAGRGPSLPRQPAPADRHGRARLSVARPSHGEQDARESVIDSATQDEAAAPALEHTSSSSDVSSASSQHDSDDDAFEEAAIDSAEDDAGDEDHGSPADSDDEGSDSNDSAPDTGPPAPAAGRGRRRGLLHQSFDTRLLHSSMGALSMLTQAWDSAAAQGLVVANEEVQAWADTCARTSSLDVNNDSKADAANTRSPSLLWNSSRIHVHTSAKEAAGVLHCAYPLEPACPSSPHRRDREATSLPAPSYLSTTITALHGLPTRRLSGAVAKTAVMEDECTLAAANGEAVDITPERLYIKRSTRYSHTASPLLPARLQHHWRLLPTILRYPDRPWSRHSGQAETDSQLTHGAGSLMAPGAFQPDPANAEPISISLDADERIMAKWERERLSQTDSASMPAPAHPGREGYTHFAAHRSVYDHHVSSLPNALWHMRGQVQHHEQTSVPAGSSSSPSAARSSQAHSSASVGRVAAVTQSRSSIAVPASAAPNRKSIFSDADISDGSIVPPVRAGAGREVQVQHSRSFAPSSAEGTRLTPTAEPFSLDGSHLPAEIRDMWRVQSVILAQSCATHRADLLFLLWAIGQGGNRRQVQDLLVGAGAASVLARVVRATNWLRPLSIVKQDHVHGPNCKCGDRESAEVASWLRVLHTLIDRDSDRPDQTWWPRRRVVTTWELNAMYFDPERPRGRENESCLLLEALRASACTPSGWNVLVDGQVKMLPPGKEATYAAVWTAFPAVPSQPPALYVSDPIDACHNATDRAYSKFDLLALDLEGSEGTPEGSVGSAGTVREALDRSTRAERLHKNTLRAASARGDTSCHPVATMPKEPLGPVAVLCAALTAMGMATDNTDQGPSGVKKGSPTADFVHRGSIGMVLEVWLRQAPATARLWAARQGRADGEEGGLIQGLVWPMLQEAVMADLVSAHGTSWLGVAQGAGAQIRFEDQGDGAQDSAGHDGDAGGEGQEDEDPKKYDHQLMMDCLASLTRRLPSLLVPLEQAQLAWLGKHLPSMQLRFASPTALQAPCVAAAPHLLLRLCSSRTTDGSLLLRSLLLCEDWSYGLWQCEKHVNMGPYLQHGLAASADECLRTGRYHVTNHPWSWTALAKASQALVSRVLGSDILPWPQWEDTALAPGLTCASLSFMREVRVPLLHTLMSRCATTQLKQDSVYVCTLVLLQLVIAHRHGALPGLIAAVKRYDAAVREHTKRLAQGKGGVGPMRLPTLQDDLIVTTSESSSAPMQLIDTVPEAAHLYGPSHGDGVHDAQASAEGMQDVDGPVLRGVCRQLALWVSYTSLRDRDRRTLKLTSGYSWEEWRAVARATLGLSALHAEQPGQAAVVGKVLPMHGSGAPTAVPDLDGLGFGHSIVLERLPGEPHCSCSPHTSGGCTQELHTGRSQPGLGVNRPLPHPHGLAAVHSAGQAYAESLHHAWVSAPAGLAGGSATAYWSACALLSA